jgi:hypothetical protein
LIPLTRFLQLATSISAVRDKLVVDAKAVADRRAKTEYATRDDNNSLTTLPAGLQIDNAKYKALWLRLQAADVYAPIRLEAGFLPDKAIERFRFLTGMTFPSPVQHFSHHYGNNLGHVNFVWRLPLSVPEDRRIEDAVQLCKSEVKKIPVQVSYSVCGLLQLLDEQLVPHERRHGQQLFLPAFISARTLNCVLL